MINRDLITAKILSYNGTLDEYGQPRKDTPTETQVSVTKPVLYKHAQVEDVRFADVTDTCLTFDKDITDANELKINDTTTYYIKFVCP